MRLAEPPDCAERTLALFETRDPSDSRPRDALNGLRAFARGEVRIGEVRALSARAHAAAREIEDEAAVAAARAAGQAAGVAHMAAHARGAAAYAAKAAGLAAPHESTAGDTTHNHRRPRALLLDLDETLVDNSGIPESVKRACHSIAAAVVGIDADQLLHENTKAWATYWPQVEERCWVGKMEIVEVSREVWRRALEACGRTDEAAVQLALDTHQRLGRDACRSFDDVPDFVAHARRSALALAVVTNGSSMAQRDKLRLVGLDEILDAVVITGELGVAKPDPAPFLAALDQLGVPPAEAWHIGDSLTTDVAGAQAAGITAVWLNRKGAPLPDDGPRPDLQASALSEIADWLP